MNKNNKKILDELRDVTKMTLNIQKLNWYNQELIMKNCYYRHIIKQAIEYIEQNCIDDEFYINLTRKEKEIIKVLDLLKGSVDDE